MKKVMCVHLVGLTGVDFLFQDVDVVWFKDPLPYFLDPTSPVYNYDAYFQVSILPNCSCPTAVFDGCLSLLTQCSGMS